MAQGPISTFVFGQNPSKAAKAVQTDANGNLTVVVASSPANPSSLTSHLNITAATVVKASAGFIGQVSVLVAGSGNGTVNDCTTTGAAATSNEVFPLSDAAVATFNVNWPCASGIVVTPGTGQTIAITYV